MITKSLFSNIPVHASFNIDGEKLSSLHVKRMDCLGNVLTTPASLWLTGFSRVFLLDFKPGWWGQKSNAFKETLYRTALVITGIVSIPFVLLGLLFGTPLLAISNRWRKDFEFQSPLSEYGESIANKIKILTFNTGLTPEFIAVRNKLRPTMERVHEVIQTIIEKDSDIICLQEVFNEEAASIISERLRQKGYYVVHSIGKPGMGLNSGLLLASKQRLEDIQFYAHPLADGWDSMASKGIVISTIKLKNKNIVIANYHLNGGGDKIPGFVCRAAQQMAMREHLERYIRHKTHNVTLLVGDANIGPLDHDDKRDQKTGLLIPKIESEWFLADRLQKESEKEGNPLGIPNGNQMCVKTAWNDFIEKIKKIYAELESSLSKERWENLIQKSVQNQTGGPFPSKFYKHQLHLKGAEKEAIKGTAVDLDFSPKDTSIATLPRYLDFIALRREPIEPQMKVEITPMLFNQKFSSDHHALCAEVFV